MPIILTTLPIYVYVIVGIGIVMLVWLIYLDTKLKRLLGTNAKNLEEGIIALRKEVKEIITFRNEMEHYLKSVELRLQKSVQGVETIRFNPFKGDGLGGNQSFATAFLNQKGDGVILSSMYGRDRVSVFSKPVANHKSLFELSEEETEVLTKAEKNLKI